MQPCRSSHPRHPTRDGFTLLELTIVVLIVGILTAAAAPKYTQALAQTRLRAAAKMVQSDLRLARSHAQRISVSQTVSFSTVNDSYTLPGLESINRRGSSQSRALTDVDLSSADFGSSTAVTFDIFGHPNNAGSVTLQSGGYSMIVTLNAVGEVSIN